MSPPARRDAPTGHIDPTVEAEAPSAAEYRAMAQHCRDIAAQGEALSPEARDHMLRVAERFERSAAELERKAAAQPT